MHGGLEAGAEPALRPTDPLGRDPDLAALAREQRDDPVGLTQLLGAKDHALVTVEGHRTLSPDAVRRP